MASFRAGARRLHGLQKAVLSPYFQGGKALRDCAVWRDGFDWRILEGLASEKVE
jgi:hypothetical protein